MHCLPARKHARETKHGEGSCSMTPTIVLSSRQNVPPTSSVLMPITSQNSSSVGSYSSCMAVFPPSDPLLIFEASPVAFLQGAASCHLCLLSALIRRGTLQRLRLLYPFRGRGQVPLRTFVSFSRLEILNSASLKPTNTISPQNMAVKLIYTLCFTSLLNPA